MDDKGSSTTTGNGGLERPQQDTGQGERLTGDRTTTGAVVHHGSGDINQAGRDIIVHHHAVHHHSAPALPPPRQLPPDTRYFTGRHADIDALNSLVRHEEEGPSGPVVISAIAGTAGVGKTALAVHWAHSVRDRFPDGQLYIDLRGFAQGPRVQPAEALGMFLTALDVPPDRLPAGQDERQALYRSKLHSRRVLIVLDNAATPDQVRPLVPSTPTCLVVVTSRSSLAGLVALEGARRITLGLLSSEEAMALLRKVIGAGRADAEPDAAAALVRMCACLPLALRIAAERVAAQSHSTLADLAEELATEQDRLDVLAADDDPAAVVRAVFSWSYRALPAESARLFRLLGLHSGPDISTHAAAALADTTHHRARRLLRHLTSGHLLEEIARERYRFHDLLRIYAAERAEAEETAPDRDAAVRRVLTWYLHTADAADRLLIPQRRHIPLDSPGTVCWPLTFTTHSQALEWCETEHANLVAGVHHAADTGHHTLAWKLPIALVGYFYLRKPWADWITTHQAGLAASRHLRDRYAEAWLLSSLADAYHDLGRFDEALDCYRQGLAIARDIGDRWAEGFAVHGVGATYVKLGQFEKALHCYRQALAIARDIGDGWALGFALNNLADAYRHLRRLEEAIDHYQQALTIRRTISDRWAEGITLNNLGEIHRELSRPQDAVDHYQQALTIRREIRDRHGEAQSLYGLGEAQYDIGRTEAARASWCEAVTIFKDLDDPRSAEVSARLETLDPHDRHP